MMPEQVSVGGLKKGIFCDLWENNYGFADYASRLIIIKSNSTSLGVHAFSFEVEGGKCGSAAFPSLYSIKFQTRWPSEVEANLPPNGCSLQTSKISSLKTAYRKVQVNRFAL
jgi:hypothetical protein